MQFTTPIKRQTITALVAAIVLLPLSTANAAANALTANDSAAAKAQTVNDKTEVIVVTARGRQELLKNVSDTIKVFDSTLLKHAGIGNIQAVSSLTSNMSMSNDQEPAVTTLTIRDISSVRNSDAPMAFVVDGVAAGSALVLGQEMIDIERIEVMKGPQGSEIKAVGDFPVTSVGVDPVADFSAKRLPLNADFSAAIAAEYITPLFDGIDLMIRGDDQYQGKTYWWFDNADAQQGFSLFNLRADLLHQQWDIIVYADNLFNRAYFTTFYPHESVGGHPIPTLPGMANHGNGVLR